MAIPSRLSRIQIFFLPKALGILLMIGCFGYLANFAGSFFFSHYNETHIENYITLPASLGELCICLWLLIKGVKDEPVST
ncbi:DUF4386 family protein [Mucilaginibacter jinjuensis]|uniref:DUF4386 family protein n=1 Tax=Mucilaginibacter jinjuensis TaxID=1176721 RepID=A0ABY7TFR9_9SPHI|nr:DUF4386 family protein [Mucilaginibacter jinjuensis]WCT15043.1 DUF4386 family protein [Mucilaginibacter jinjuensis]